MHWTATVFYYITNSVWCIKYTLKEHHVFAEKVILETKNSA